MSPDPLSYGATITHASVSGCGKVLATLEEVCQAVHKATRCTRVLRDVADVNLRSLHSLKRLVAMDAADTDFQLEKAWDGIAREWKLSGAVLLGIAAVDAEAFSLSFSSTQNIVAFRCLVVSIAVTTQGLSLLAYLLFSYAGLRGSWSKISAINVRKKRSIPVASRLPLLFAILSALALCLSILAVAYSASPLAVITVSAVTSVLVGMKYLANVMMKIDYIFRVLVQGMLAVVRDAKTRVVSCLRSGTQSIHPGREAAEGRRRHLSEALSSCTMEQLTA